MLEAREADIPIFFLVLVVIPVVVYILLGRWSEALEKRGRSNFLPQMAAEEALEAETVIAANGAQRGKTVGSVSGALRAETVAAESGVPFMVRYKNKEIHLCARCSGPAKTRCSRCKSIRYCSGNCQIIHWRVAHKDECVPVKTCSTSTGKSAYDKSSVLHEFNTNDPTYKHDAKQAVRVGKSTNEVGISSEDTIGSASLSGSQVNNAPQVHVQGRRSVGKRYYSCKSSRESSSRDGVCKLDCSEEFSRGQAACTGGNSNSMLKNNRVKQKLRNNGYAVGENPTRHAVGNSCMQMNEQPFTASIQESYNQHSKYENGSEGRSSSGCPSTQFSAKGARTAKFPKSGVSKSGEHQCTESTWNGPVKVYKTVSQESNGISTMGIMKMMDLRKSTKVNTHKQHDDHHKKLKMLFPYEEFVRFFQSEVFDLSPRGLVNFGNSCYANAVLQALTCTKPLVVYLLQRSHSRSCCGKGWCLMCELEQHVMMLRETGGPLSASRILSHMRSSNCQIGDGSQEDAHEFLRLLIASMQSICLERIGDESKVDPRMQETTLIQHMFGGRLRSKVKCLRCDHESERYENIMDLTLEIYGWVESLEDALTQFTTLEDLDGENMYRCSRCAGYVQARKQLSVHEAPNILTIVLKRFQEGGYGKLNKCITFPEMLDMIPFMTGTGVIPPIYMLYAVVVHLDTLNASFSGHYISYVKDLRGNWFRIDDSEIHQVPINQVMSEGAYMLFYTRSHPRPQRRELNRKSQGNQHNFAGKADHFKQEFSDATSSSEWSLFTSSDEASFTTESTRDSFSTSDYTDSSPFYIFNNLAQTKPSTHNTVACRMFSGTK